MKPSKNYLDYIPKIKEGVRYDVGDKQDVTVYVENRGAMNWLVQKLLHKPRITKVHLDAMGNYIWSLMNGERSVYEIGCEVREHFGDDAEPLYERLVRYMESLVEVGFVEMR